MIVMFYGQKNDVNTNKSNCVMPLFLYSGGYRLSVVSSFFEAKPITIPRAV